MDAERRRFMRFSAPLKVQTRDSSNQSVSGEIKDFSRDGLSAVFNNLELKPNSYVDLQIQNPGQDTYSNASAQVVWGRSSGSKCHIGLRFSEFSPRVKADILEYGYKKWVEGQQSS